MIAKPPVWRVEQQRCLALIREHRDANQTYLEKASVFSNSRRRPARCFVSSPRLKKRRLLGFVLSNCIWKDGQLTAEYKQPFDLLAKNVIALERKMPAEGTQTGISEKWLRLLGSNQRPND